MLRNLGGRGYISNIREIQSVSRALNILEVLSKAQSEGKVGEMQLGEIAIATDLNVSTCHHILLTLMKVFCTI